MSQKSFASEEPSLPAAHLCFHGLIERREAERRLLDANQENCFLVRESKASSSPQKWFVLSFFGRKSGVNHFRVQHFCQHFYIGSKAFPTLDALIRFYHFSDLLRGERLQNAVAPKEPVADSAAAARRLVAVLPYAKIPDSDELSFKKGDLFVVHNDLQNGWLWCTNDRTLESGLVFAELLETVDDKCDENETHEWFHSKITKEEAVDRLAKAGVGSFLVRPSDTQAGNYSLFFHIGHSVQRFRIERRGDRYVMGGRVFRSLYDVIERYKSEQIVEGFRLERAVCKQAFEEHVWSEETARQRLERHKDDSVYQTLRESRELARKSSAIRLSGFLHKKSQKHKKWKPLYFALNQNDCALYYYDNERRARPKGIVDLNYSYVYCCHDSLFDRQFVFQVVERALPCISTVYYLSSTDAETCRQWVRNIQSLCRPQQRPQRSASPTTGDDATTTTADDDASYREVRSLYITLLEAQNLPLKCAPNPYVEIQFNSSVKCARTSVKCPPDPIWEEDFPLEDIPPDVLSFSFVLYNKAKRQKDTEIAETTLELSKLANNEEFEDWFSLSGLCPPIRDSWGQLRARIRFTRELILSFGEYSALKDLLLMTEDLEVIQVCELFCARDRLPLATALLKIARFERNECPLFKAMIEREIRQETDVATLFRANSLTTAIVDLFARAISEDFIRHSLLDPINKVLDSKNSCELNPARLSEPSEACHNAEHLLDLLDHVVDHIFANGHHCPQPLRYICGCLQRAVIRKWPHDLLVRSRVVSGFVFLRLICPAILNPRNFSLINEIPSETASRTLILIAKCVQNLANLVEFGTKSIFITPDRFEPPPPPNSKREPWMEIVNPFILKNKSKMIKYLDELAAVSSQAPPPSAALWSPSKMAAAEAPARELALIHSICDLHVTEIQEMARERPTLKKLATVVDLLTKRKTRISNK